MIQFYINKLDKETPLRIFSQPVKLSSGQKLLLKTICENAWDALSLRDLLDRITSTSFIGTPLGVYIKEIQRKELVEEAFYDVD